jgi:hypothetical protein
MILTESDLFSSAQVKAIRVDAASALEAKAQTLLFSTVQKTLQLDEEPFIAQLCLRSRLLNDPFFSNVVEVVSGHAVLPLGPRMLQKRFSQGSSIKLMQEMRRETCGLASFECMFDEGPGLVEVHPAPIKTAARMREKLHEYGAPDGGGAWPFAASILDPVRASVVCKGASQVLQVLSWFTAAQARMPVCRIKNLFALDHALPSAEGSMGYRDLKVFVLMEGFGGLRVIGEIQVLILQCTPNCTV